jgi:hypothetical protein
VEVGDSKSSGNPVICSNVVLSIQEFKVVTPSKDAIRLRDSFNKNIIILKVPK